MDNTKRVSWWQAHKPTTRRLIQLYSALLHNAHLKGFISGSIYQGRAKFACAPGLNCYSCPAASGACPLGAIQNALASAGHTPLWYVLGMLLLFGVVLGRTICGWLCPMGLIQELLHKLPTPKLRKGRASRALSWLKYIILAVFVVALPLWYGLRYDLPLPAFCKYICPAGTSEGAMGLLANTMPANTGYFSMLGLLFTRKFVIMLVIGLVCVFCYRSFCRFICPLGALYGLFNRFNVIGVRVDEDLCNGCGACVRGCSMDVRRVGDHECIHCGRCMDMCARGAISIKAGRITLSAPAQGCAEDHPDASAKRRRLGRVLWGIALAALCFALMWFNALDPAVKKESMPGDKPAPAVTAAQTEAPAETQASMATETPTETDTPIASVIPAETESPAAAELPVETSAPATPSWKSDAPEGREVGEVLPDFALPCYDGSEFRLTQQRGKITFINLWATSCTPCKHELPYFSELFKAHEGDIAMLIVHSSMVMDDPEVYLADKGFAMPFATDDDDDTVAEIVGNTGTFPQTIVLNRRGEVVFNKVGSVTPEMLDALYREAEQ